MWSLWTAGTGNRRRVELWAAFASQTERKRDLRCMIVGCFWCRWHVDRTILCSFRRTGPCTRVEMDTTANWGWIRRTIMYDQWSVSHSSLPLLSKRCCLIRSLKSRVERLSRSFSPTKTSWSFLECSNSAKASLQSIATSWAFLTSFLSAAPFSRSLQEPALHLFSWRLEVTDSFWWKDSTTTTFTTGRRRKETRSSL